MMIVVIRRWGWRLRQTQWVAERGMIIKIRLMGWREKLKAGKTNCDTEILTSWKLQCHSGWRRRRRSEKVDQVPNCCKECKVAFNNNTKHSVRGNYRSQATISQKNNQAACKQGWKGQFSNLTLVWSFKKFFFVSLIFLHFLAHR